MGAAHDVAYGDVGMGWGRVMRVGWASDEVEAAEMRRVMRRKREIQSRVCGGRGVIESSYLQHTRRSRKHAAIRRKVRRAFGLDADAHDASPEVA